MRNGFRFAALSAMWGGSLALSLWRGGFSNWFLCYSLGFLIVYILAVRLFSLNGLKADVHLSASAYFSGEEAVITVSVLHRSALPPAWLLIKQEWKHLGSSRVIRHRKLYMPWFQSVFTYRYKLAGLRRGHYELKRTEAVSGDIFGFLFKPVRCQSNANFAVNPRPLPIWLRSSFGGNEGLHATIRKNAETAVTFAVRDYVCGDPPNLIDWKATARTGQFKTKDRETVPGRKTAVFLDASAASYLSLSAEAEPVFEACISLAAGLLGELWRKRGTVSLICSDEAQSRIPSSDRLDLRLVNDVLTAVRYDGNAQFGETVKREAFRLPADSQIVCITSSLNDSFLETVKQLRAHRREVDVLFVHAGLVLSWQNRRWREMAVQLGCGFTDLAAAPSDKRPGKQTEEVAEDVAAS